VLTDHGTQFVDRAPSNEEAEAAAEIYRAARGEPRVRSVHAFGHACEKHRIGHRTTKPAHPWTNGQVERMNRTLKDATVRRYRCGSHDELRRHLRLFLDAYNHARRLETLRGLTPCEFICKTWTEQPSRADRVQMEPSERVKMLVKQRAGA
jgi:transposase InsO family protein